MIFVNGVRGWITDPMKSYEQRNIKKNRFQMFYNERSGLNFQFLEDKRLSRNRTQGYIFVLKGYGAW